MNSLCSREWPWPGPLAVPSEVLVLPVYATIPASLVLGVSNLVVHARQALCQPKGVVLRPLCAVERIA